MSYKLQIKKMQVAASFCSFNSILKASKWRDFNMAMKYCCCHSTEFLPKHVSQALDSVLLKFQTKQPTIFVHF